MTDHIGDELVLLNAVTNAQRRLLGMRRREEATDVLVEVVRALGGRVVPADLRPLDAIPLDLTFGERETLVPAAAPGTPVRGRLERLMPALVEQARGMVNLLDAAGRLDPHGSLDLLTGLQSRDRLGRVLERALAGDRLVGFAIDGYPDVVGRYGRVRAEGALRELADLLDQHVHPADHTARVGPGAVAALMVRPSEDQVDQLRRTVLTGWPRHRPLDVEVIWTDLGVADHGGRVLDELDHRLDIQPAADRRHV